MCIDLQLCFLLDVYMMQGLIFGIRNSLPAACNIGVTSALRTDPPTVNLFAVEFNCMVLKFPMSRIKPLCNPARLVVYPWPPPVARKGSSFTEAYCT